MKSKRLTNKALRATIASVLCLMLAICMSITSFAQDGPVKNETQGTTHATIQEAINAATAGDVILVTAGEYQENIVVDKNLTIKGEADAIIKFDAATKVERTYSGSSQKVYPIVYATADLVLENITITGPTAVHHGIDGVFATAGLTMTNVTVTDIRCTDDDNEICGVQYGKGVVVDGSGDVTIENCKIVKFQKQAIDMKTTGKIVIADNTITGVGTQGIIGQNGIVLRAGVATITGNTVSELNYSAENEWDHCSYGISLSSDVVAEITENTIQGADNGINLKDDVEATITNNIITSDYIGLNANTTGEVTAPNNYWNGDVAEKVGGSAAADVVGLDNVKEEAVLCGEPVYVAAKDPSETEEGNIEYWYCETCDEYYKDADLTQVIEEADTVIPKVTVPDTGDNDGIFLLLALALVGGMGIVAVKKYGKNNV